MNNLKIQFDEFPGQTRILNPETGEPFSGMLGFHLTVTPQGYEAKIITDEPLVEGSCTVPVTEQLVLSPEFLSMLAKLVAQEIIKRGIIS